MTDELKIPTDVVGETTEPAPSDVPADAVATVDEPTNPTPAPETEAVAVPTAEAAPAAAPVIEVVAAPTERVFRTGATVITESDAMKSMSVAEVQRLLTPAYPELANADAVEARDGDRLVVNFIAKAGRKG
jgi:hypothetical protein